MSKQIKIIWILSLISVLLLIGIQGYWLINQYEYVLNSYSGEIALLVLQAGEEEYINRKDDSPVLSTFMIRANRESSMFKSRVVIGTPGPDTQPAKDDIYLPQEQTQFWATQSARSVNTLHQIELETIIIDTTQYYTDYFTNLSGDALRDAAEKAIANQVKPFDQAQFDSILESTLPTLAYSILPWQENDWFDSSEVWKRTGNLFSPYLTVNYAFSPLENKGVSVLIKLPVQPVFFRMGIQLIVSIGITFLLIVCLIFQVRTILKQRKMNEIRENFVNTMVHELKRPVQTLKTFVSFLKDQKMRSDAEATEQVVRDAMFELDNLSAYLNKLKDMLQADSETTSLHINPV